MDVCMMVYWGRVGDGILETALKTFRKHSDGLLQVYTDSISDMDYGVRWVTVPKSEIDNMRCYRKMKCIRDCMAELKDGDRLIVSDVDVYFLSDPFSAFDKEFDIGITTRIHSYNHLVNSGVFFIRVNGKTRDCFDTYFTQFADRNRDKWDWFVDQLFLCELWELRNVISPDIVDVGWRYNFCPNTDTFGVELASDMIKRAYESKSVEILHLKSELKMCIFDGFLEDAVVKSLKNWNWKKMGELNALGNTYKTAAAV